MSDTPYAMEFIAFHNWLQELIKTSADTARQDLDIIELDESVDILTRCKIIILSNYAMGGFQDKSPYIQLIAEQVTWLIYHQPQHPILYLPFSYASLLERKEVKHAWLEVTVDSENAITLFNASLYFLHHDLSHFFDLARRTLETGTTEPLILDHFDFIMNLKERMLESIYREHKSEIENIRALLNRAIDRANSQKA